MLTIIFSFQVKAAGECGIRITVTDQTSAYAGDISIIFNFQSGPEFIVINSNDFSKENVYSFPRDGEVAISSSISGDKFRIIDESTGKELNSIELVKDAVVDLKILIQEISDSENKVDYKDLFNFDDVIEESMVAEEKTYDIEDGEKLFKKFIDASYFLNDEKYSDYLKLNSLASKKTLETNTKISSTQWESLSLYERYIYCVTYLHLASIQTQGQAKMFHLVGDDVKVTDDLRFYLYERPRVDEKIADEFTQAWEDFMSWQVGYFAKYGGPYDFVMGMSYAEEVYGDIAPSNPKESQEDKETVETKEVSETEVKEEKPIEEVTKEIVEESNSTEEKVQETQEEKGIWSDVMDTLYSMKFTIIILAILLVALGVITFIIKKKNIDGMSNDGK